MSIEPGFLITGSGRCGTAYTAHVLRECGLNVEHEGWWTLHHDPIAGLDGDVSWLGCFDDNYTGPVYAQVRSPWTAIPSIYAREQTAPYWMVRRLTCSLTGDWVVDAALIWVNYTVHAADRARHWWRIEDLDAQLLAAEFDVDPDRAAKAVEATDITLNAGPLDVDYPWIDSRIGVMRQVRRLARQLGYPEERYQ